MLLCHLLATNQDKDRTLIPMDVVGKLQEAILVCFKRGALIQPMCSKSMVLVSLNHGHFPSVREKINHKSRKVSQIHKESYRNPLKNRETKFRNFIKLNLKIITVNLKFRKLL